MVSIPDSGFFFIAYLDSNAQWALGYVFLVALGIAIYKIVAYIRKLPVPVALEKSEEHYVVSPFLIPENNAGLAGPKEKRYALWMKAMVILLTLVFVSVPFFEFLPALEPKVYWVMSCFP